MDLLPLNIALHALSIEMRGLEGAQEGVSHAESFRDDLVDVLHVHHAAVHHAPHLVQDRVSGGGNVEVNNVSS